MVKKQSSMKQHFPYLAIVAVVAVVAIVFLVLNFTGISSTGEAVRFTRTASTAASAPASSQEECNSLERRCDLAKKEDVQKLIFVSLNEINKFYNGGSWQGKNNGNKICSDMGYNGCFVSEHTGTTFYRSSSDKSCSGEIQLTLSSTYLMKCDAYIVSKSVGCDNKNEGFWLPGNTEPEYGDFEFMEQIKNVICVE
ncbi:MAG: hypothetical protein AABW48_02605 [Nanoarchaeota archaeon]